MLSLRKSTEMNPISLDRFRGTIQRWTIDAGPLAGTICDHAFNDDWSLTWRVVAGPTQGQVGRAREFFVQPIRAQLFLVSFPILRGIVVTANVDFASRRLTGFQSGLEHCVPLGGSFRTL
jgi:hypothetical protein